MPIEAYSFFTSEMASEVLRRAFRCLYEGLESPIRLVINFATLMVDFIL